MYDWVLGDGNQGNRGTALLGLLGNPDPGRYRDAWVEKDEGGRPIIAVYTRNGGGNREHDGCEENACVGCRGEAFAAHELHIRNVDDEFDSTYATYYFEFPDDGARETFAEVAVEHVDTSARWHEAIEALGTMGVPPGGDAAG